MDQHRIFDRNLLRQRRLRALRQHGLTGDFLLARAADDLEERLSAVERSFDVAVDLASHTGLAAKAIERSGKAGSIIRIEQDVRFLDAAFPSVVADEEMLPLKPAGAGLIVSLLSLHLTNDTPGTLLQIRRALKPDGLFLGAMAGEATLSELREVLLATESEISGGASPRVAPFADVRDVGGLLQRAGFTLPVTDIETYTVRYDSLFALMRDLRAMGMQNILFGRSRKPLTRRFFLRAAEIYAERFSDPDGRIRATFSFIWMSGWAAHESQQKPLKPGSAKASLADFLKDPAVSAVAAFAAVAVEDADGIGRFLQNAAADRVFGRRRLLDRAGRHRVDGSAGRVVHHGFRLAVGKRRNNQCECDCSRTEQKGYAQDASSRTQECPGLRCSLVEIVEFIPHAPPGKIDPSLIKSRPFA
eukprot:gene9407-11552_t